MSHIGAGARGDRAENVAHGGKSGFDSCALGCTLPCTTPQTPGTRFTDGVIPMMQVDVPTTFTMSSVRQPAPIASQCASKAPTGIGIPGLQSQLLRPVRRQRSRDLLGCGVLAIQLFADSASSGSTFTRNSPAEARPVARFHIHLWPMAQTLRFTFSGR